MTGRHPIHLVRALLILGVSAALTACVEPAEPPEGSCLTDEDCPAGQFCDGGVCKCRTDDACGEGFYCNDYGNCQERPPCVGNADCPEAYICNSADPSGGECIPQNECGADVHCPFNFYCVIAEDAVTGTCEYGCRDTGDCQLGYICRANRCQLGATVDDCFGCSSNPVPDATYCDYGERCVATTGLCGAVPGAELLCDRCDQNCPHPSVTCLIDRESCACIDNKCYPTDEPCDTAEDCAGIEECNVNYCAPICDEDADCPNGYAGCGSLVSVCGVCQSDADCDIDGSVCVFGTESDAGYCSCTGQDDCDAFALPEGICSPYDDTCTVICFEDADCTFVGGTGCPHLCEGGMATCETDADCLVGSCLSYGFCEFAGANPHTCNSDDDCACLNGICNISGYPCDSAADCGTTFEPFDDENPGGGGFCATNTKVCGKNSGYLCEDLQGEAMCREF